MKTRKTTFTLIIAFVMMTGLAFAGETTTSMAKKELLHEITSSLNDGIKDWNNYFYQNDINKVDEKVRVYIVVNKDQSLKLIRVVCENPDATGYVKHIFGSEKMKADKALVGTAYRFNLSLRYIAQ
jgi:hypothetical protein